MMKRVFSMLLVLALVFALVGCGGSKAKDVDVTGLAAELAEKVAFAEELKEHTAETLGNYVDVPEGAKAAFYMAGGITMEEIIAVQCASEKDAQTLKGALETLLQNQRDEVGRYQPEAVPRLEKAILLQKGSCVVLCVTDDTDTAERIIKEYLG